ncbi:two-component system, NarL family, sensor histidine kinase DegS [Alteribacillus iranensis]|uniref:Signal transduction histidine-protein kinase/phosphatase DegS n=2 Tax=Alteribacillus iranensis TaxID=930128 RepID=A0A1I2EJ29_9BACI|nr:two-component system, NarL family, sensor histidine kinase DegS [Alteribacillus iranensis]
MTLDEIINKMVHTVEQSKEQIFEISEQSRDEYESLKAELVQVREDVAKVIDKSEQTEMYARFARNRLAEVSRHFRSYSNDEVKKVYENANELQIKLAVLQQEESQLRQRRDQIERRLIQLEGTIERAETLVSQVSIVHQFLAGDLREVGEMVEDAKEIQQFGLKIIEAQEEERKRVARDIHDGPAQMLANVLLRSEIVERVSNEQGVDAAIDEIKDLKTMIRSSLAEVRRIIYDLRPMALDDLGLIPTLNKYLQNMEERTGLIIRFSHLGRDLRLPANVEVGLFRLIQEAVQNTYKHAEANEVQVKLEMKPSQVNIVIKDDGKGFESEKSEECTFGLLGMRERINALKGQLTIDSIPNKGTVIIIQVPVEGFKGSPNRRQPQKKELLKSRNV